MTRHTISALCLLAAGACSPGVGTSPNTGPGGAGLPVGLDYVGTFHPVIHDGQGTAEVYVAQDGSKELRFSDDFATASGPRLEVWLVRAADATDSKTVLDSAHVSLGPLQSDSGAQHYAVPSGVNLGVYRSVTVWCTTFQVNFTTAPLMMQ